MNAVKAIRPLSQGSNVASRPAVRHRPRHASRTNRLKNCAAQLGEARAIST